MKMKKIKDRVYEFWNLNPEDSNREITDVEFTEVEDDIDYSKYEFYFGEDFCLLKEDNCDVEDEVFNLPEPEVTEEVVILSKPKSKKDEINESLSYLKSKPSKTKQDREAIYTLEIVLKSMK